MFSYRFTNFTYLRLNRIISERICDCAVIEFMYSMSHIQIFPDVKSVDIDGIIKETKEYVQNYHKTLIVFILSHGVKDGLIMSDGINLPFESIWTPFANVNFPQFAEKAKLFFFACCQGDNIDPGYPSELLECI